MPRDFDERWRSLRSGFRRLFAIPDYDAYLEHRRRTHPGEPVMSHEQFFRHRLEQRYGSGSSGMRCC
jgi:uncharacterized short protein YbdD (DUF466 family)